MNYYFAPMEGITYAAFRNVHAKHFPGIDRYYTPFLSANHSLSFQTKEKRDVDPANNTVPGLIPQLLTKNAEEFLCGAGFLKSLGYPEVNFNLGCPSSTVTAKGKGAGFLRNPEGLLRFFDAVFSADPGNIPAISVKARLGYADASEAEELVSIFNRFPIKELIAHARVREQMYSGKPDLEGFQTFYERAAMPLCYNGDLCSTTDVAKIREAFPDLNAVMIGRGLLSNPALVRELKGGTPLTKEEFLFYHNDLFSAYLASYSERIAVGRMKELWFYWEKNLPCDPKALKAIRKANGRMEYIAAINTQFMQ